MSAKPPRILVGRIKRGTLDEPLSFLRRWWWEARADGWSVDGGTAFTRRAGIRKARRVLREEGIADARVHG